MILMYNGYTNRFAYIRDFRRRLPPNFNVLVYIASGDPVKADRAEVIIGDGGACAAC